MSRNDDYITATLIDFSYHQNYHKIIGIDLLRQRNTRISQKINLIGKVEEDHETQHLLLLKSSKKVF